MYLSPVTMYSNKNSQAPAFGTRLTLKKPEVVNQQGKKILDRVTNFASLQGEFCIPEVIFDNKFLFSFERNAKGFKAMIKEFEQSPAVNKENPLSSLILNFDNRGMVIKAEYTDKIGSKTFIRRPPQNHRVIQTSGGSRYENVKGTDDEWRSTVIKYLDKVKPISHDTPLNSIFSTLSGRAVSILA